MGTIATLLLALAAVAAHGAGARAAVDQREMKAREAFAVGKYQEALDLFAKLYAEKLHPNYLRNIGRCYQNLGQPDQAINSFREYLRKAKTVSADERQEVEGYIKEMEDLRAKQQATATPPPPPPDRTGTQASTGGSTTIATTTASTGTTPATTTPDLNVTNSAATAATTTPAGTDLSGGAPSASGEGDRPLYARWWFWAIVVGVIGVGVGAAAAAGAFTKTENASCPEGSRC